MSDTPNDTTHNLETRILFLGVNQPSPEAHIQAVDALDKWRDEGFVIAMELFDAGVVYIRLERDNAAIAEQKRWDALNRAEKIVENVRGMGLA